MAVAFAALLGSLAASNSGQAQSFGVHFLGNTTDQVTGTAGVDPMAGWNNIANTTFTSGTILASDGTTAATLSLTGSGRVNAWHSGTASDGGNSSLLDGYMDTGINNPSTSTISGLTGSLYDVWVYFQGDTARPSNGGDWLPNYTINGTTYYTATAGGNTFSGLTQASTTAANNNTYPTTLTLGNYIEIANVAPVGGSIVISANSDNQTWRSPLNGFEIASVPEPSPAMLSVAGLAVAGLWRARRALKQ